MRVLILLLILALHPMTVRAEDANPPPNLLGVWYGSYPLGPGTDSIRVEFWMGVYSQGSDGWSVSGHNRWHVPESDEAVAHGAASLGQDAEHFDTFSGRLDQDRVRLHLREDSRGSRIEATLVGDATLDATFSDPSGAQPTFQVTLKRVDTGYDPAAQPRLGIDVSHHSGTVDWVRVREQGFRFAYIKASEGVDAADPMFDTHWKALQALDLARGAYHFYVTEDDPLAQARFFASRLKDDPGTLPPAVDVELLGKNTTGDMSDALLNFLRSFEQQTGIKPMIYTSGGFWDRYYRPEFSGYPLWMAEYGVRMPKVPFGWTRWTFWQQAENRPVDGVQNNADVSLIHPDVDLQSLAPTSTKRIETR